MELLRKYAKSSGLTMGAIVTNALEAFLAHKEEAWLSRAPKAACCEIHVSYVV